MDSGCVKCGLLQLEDMGAMREVETTCETLHLWLSEDKKQLAGQRVDYTGITVDTIRAQCGSLA